MLCNIYKYREKLRKTNKKCSTNDKKLTKKIVKMLTSFSVYYVWYERDNFCLKYGNIQKYLSAKEERMRIYFGLK